MSFIQSSPITPFLAFKVDHKIVKQLTTKKSFFSFIGQ